MRKHKAPNPYREAYKQYAETQLTLEEILSTFKDYTIYSILDNTTLYIVEGNTVILLFDSIGYEDDDCMPDIYEAYPAHGECFNTICDRYLYDGCSIMKLN